jgi:hypothetical protein
MNVHLLPVIRMLPVTTLMVALSVHVKLDTVEMDLFVQVKLVGQELTKYFCILKKNCIFKINVSLSNIMM